MKGKHRPRRRPAAKIFFVCLLALFFSGTEAWAAEDAPSAPPGAGRIVAPAIGPTPIGAAGQAAPGRPAAQDRRPTSPAGAPATTPVALPGQPSGTAPSLTPAPPAVPGDVGQANGSDSGAGSMPSAPRSRRPMGMAPSSVSGGKVSLNFDDADVFSVIQTIFGDIMRVNYVIDPKVKGRVTFRSVAPIATDQVLSVMEVILRINGIGVVEDRGLYRVVPLSEVSREPSPVSFGSDASKVPSTGKSIIQVVPIVYLQSSEVVKLITPFLSANAVVLDVPKSNQLIIVDTDASVRRILQLIQAFDNETQKKKRARVFVYAVQNGKAKDIAALLQQIFLGARPDTGGSGSGASRMPPAPSGAMAGSSSGSAPPMMPSISSPVIRGSETLVSDITKIYADEIINSIIVLSTPEDYETIKETIAQIDILPRQVMIEGVIAQVTLTDNMSLGLAYSAKTRIHLGGTPLTGDIGVNADTLSRFNGTTSTSSGTTNALPASTGFSYIAKDDQNLFRVYLNALANDSNGKLLAAPHILVSDNREARIQVGQQVPIVTSSTISPAGTASGTIATQTIQYKDIGIILKIKPQVNESGLVALELVQEVSTFDTIQLGQNQTEIILNKTEASTSLVVQDGHTIAIGGLIREDNSNSKIGVPFLNRIPVLGYLFGNTSRQSNRQELIILLTPHVIKDQKEAQGNTSRYLDNITSGKTSKGGLKREEIIKSGVQSRDGVEVKWSTEEQPGPRR